MPAPDRRIAALAAALALSLRCIVAQAAPLVQVEAQNPDQFRDLGDYMGSGGRIGVANLKALSSYIELRALGALADGERLEITLTDVDMAGEFEFRRRSTLRVLRDVYPPRIDLRFRLVGANGVLIKEGERKLRDSAFLFGVSTAPYRGDPLRFEKILVDNWVESEFVRREQAAAASAAPAR